MVADWKGLIQLSMKLNSAGIKNQFFNQTRELVDEISLDIEVMDIMDEVHLFPFNE